MAYTESAKKSLENWSLATPLPSIQKGESQDMFVFRCLQDNNVKSSRPKWQVNDAILEGCVNKILRERAMQAFEQSSHESQQPTPEADHNSRSHSSTSAESGSAVEEDNTGNQGGDYNDEEEIGLLEEKKICEVVKGIVKEDVQPSNKKIGSQSNDSTPNTKATKKTNKKRKKNQQHSGKKKKIKKEVSTNEKKGATSLNQKTTPTETKTPRNKPMGKKRRLSSTNA